MNDKASVMISQIQRRGRSDVHRARRSLEEKSEGFCSTEGSIQAIEKKESVSQ